MAGTSKKRTTPLPTRRAEYPYPSRFGSHASMIDQEATGRMASHGQVILRDERGLYLTDFNRLDTGLADPNRESAAARTLGNTTTECSE